MIKSHINTKQNFQILQTYIKTYFNKIFPLTYSQLPVIKYIGLIIWTLQEYTTTKTMTMNWTHLQYTRWLNYTMYHPIRHPLNKLKTYVTQVCNHHFGGRHQPKFVNLQKYYNTNVKYIYPIYANMQLKLKPRTYIYTFYAPPPLVQARRWKPIPQTHFWGAQRLFYAYTGHIFRLDWVFCNHGGYRYYRDIEPLDHGCS